MESRWNGKDTALSLVLIVMAAIIVIGLIIIGSEVSP
jgi:hypothetical protein